MSIKNYVQSVVFICLTSFLFADNLGPKHDQFVDDASELFNERGYYNSNSVNIGSLTNINNYSGDLSFNKRLMSIPGPNGFNVNVDLTYSGSVQHIAANRYLYGGSNYIYYINHPEWILSVNGIALQVLNYEDEGYNNVNQTDLDGTVSTNHEISMQVKGYHATSLGSGEHYEMIYLLKGDGGLYSLKSEAAPDYVDEGEYVPANLDSYYRALVKGTLTETSTNRKLFLYPGDGTCIVYKEEFPNYTHGVESASDNFKVKAKTFYPQYIEDQFGNRINFIYEDFSSTVNSARKFITSIEPSWGSYISVTYPNIYSPTISCYDLGYKSILTGVQAVGIKGSFITNIVNSFTFLDWEDQVSTWIGQGNYWPYREEPQEHVYSFTYTGLGQRNMINTLNGVPYFNIIKGTQSTPVSLSNELEIDILALKTVKYENTGLLEEFDYKTLTDNSIDYIDYPTNVGCVPNYRSDDYDGLGRDPFFTNMIEDRYTKDTENSLTTKTEHYSYNWGQGSYPGMWECVTTDLTTTLTITDGQNSQNTVKKVFEYESRNYDGRNRAIGQSYDQSATKLVKTTHKTDTDVEKRIESDWDYTTTLRELTRKEYHKINSSVEYLGVDNSYAYTVFSPHTPYAIQNLESITVTDNVLDKENKTVFLGSFNGALTDYGLNPAPNQRNYYFDQIATETSVQEPPTIHSQTDIEYFTSNTSTGSIGQIKKISSRSKNQDQPDNVTNYEYFPLHNQSSSGAIYKGGELKLITDSNGNVEEYYYGERDNSRLKYTQITHTRRYHDGTETLIEGGWSKPIPMPDNYFPFENTLVMPLKRTKQLENGEVLETKLDYWYSYPTLLVGPDGYSTEIFYDPRLRVKGITKPGDYLQTAQSTPYWFKTAEMTSYNINSGGGTPFELTDTYEFTVPHTLNYNLGYDNGKGMDDPNRVYLECKIYRPSTGEVLAHHKFDFWETDPNELINLSEAHSVEIEKDDKIDITLKVGNDNTHTSSSVTLFYEDGFLGSRSYNVPTSEVIYNDDISEGSLSSQSLTLINDPYDFDPVIANDIRLNNTKNFNMLGLFTALEKESSTGTLNSTIVYDYRDRKEVETDFNGNVITYEYDDLDRVTKVINADNTEINYSYNVVTSIPDYPTLSGWTAGLDFALTKTIIDEKDHKIVVYEDALGQVRKEETYSGTSPSFTLETETFYDYDALGNVTKVLNPEEQLSTFTYDGLSRLTESDSPDNGITKYRYDGNGNLVYKQTAERASDPTYTWLYFKYDGINRVLEEGIIQENQGTLNYSNNHILKKSYTYDDDLSTNSKGRLSVAFDHESEIATKYQYDYRGRVSDKTDYFDAILAYTPMSSIAQVSGSGPVDQSQSVTLDHDQTITFDFYKDPEVQPNDGTGSIKVKRGLTTVYSNNNSSGSVALYEGDVVTVSAEIPKFKSGAASMTLHYTLNEVDNMSGEQYTTLYEYNSADLVKKITYNGQEQSPPTVDMDYNKLAQLESIPNYLDGSSGIGFVYNPNGAITQHHYNNGVGYINSYNNRNWLSSVYSTDEDHNYEYDYYYEPNGNLDRIEQEVTGSMSTIEDFTYDHLNRLTDVSYLTGFGTNRSFTYDKLGNRETSTIGGVLTTHSYNKDGSGNLLDNQILGDVGRNEDLDYDDNGNLLYDPNNGFHYEYDWDNRLVGVNTNTWVEWVSNPSYGYIFQVENGMLRFDGENNQGWKYARKDIAPITINNSNSIIDFSYDFKLNQDQDMSLLQLLLDNETEGTAFIIRYYERDRRLYARQYYTDEYGVKQITDIYNQQLSTTQNNQIKNATNNNASLIIDDVANTVTFDFTCSGSQGVQFVKYATVSLIPEIEEVNSIKIAVIEGDYSIDNIKVKTDNHAPFVHTETFDSNCPSCDDDLCGPFQKYYYNPSGDRAMKISPEGVTKYVTDGNMNVLSEYNGNGTLNYNYVYGNGQKLARVNAGGTKEYIHNDYLGSVRRISDQDGNLVWGRDYYPFGEDRRTHGGTNEDNEYTYEGKEKDLETDLWYNTARFFNDAGRFTQVDPLWSKYPSTSPYVRVANNPLVFVDPTGLYWEYKFNDDGSVATDDDGNEIKNWVYKVTVTLDQETGTYFSQNSESSPFNYDIYSFNYSGGDAITDFAMISLGGTFALLSGVQMAPTAFRLGSSVVAWSKDIGYEAINLYLGNKNVIDPIIGSIGANLSNAPNRTMASSLTADYLIACYKFNKTISR